MKNILNWPGIIGRLPLLSALLIGLTAAVSVGRPDAPAIGTASDGNAITLARYAEMFGLDLDDPAVVAGSELNALLDFDPRFTDGDVLRGFWPAWISSVFKIGGAWGESVDAWYVPAGETGKLCLVIDRTRLNAADFQLVLEFYDGGPQDSSPGSLFVDLVNSEEEILASSQDLLEDSEQIVQKAMIIPLVEEYSDVRAIYLRGEGELFVLSGALILEQGSIESAGGPEVPDNATEQPASEQAPAEHGVGRGARPAHGGVSAEPIQEATASVSPPLRASTVSTMTLTQFAMSRMTGAGLVITRCVLSGAGTRQTSPFFVLEDSFAQEAAIGFSSGGNFSLNSGFQQAEAEQLEFWNVSLTPAPYQQQDRRFNPRLGETATLSYVLSTSARTITVGVYNPSGLLVRNLVAQQPQNIGLNTVAWDGRDANNDLAPVGTYRFYLNGTNYDAVGADYGNEISIAVNTNIAVIYSVDDQPDPFAPPADSTISYVTRAPIDITDLNMTVEIFADKLGGRLIRRWNRNNQPIGSDSVVWDGTDAFGINAPDGIYAYSIWSRDGLPGRPNPQSGAITLLRNNTQTAVSPDGQVEVRYPAASTITIALAGPSDVSSALFTIQAAVPRLILQSLIYRIEATPSTSALMAFEYDPAISGDIVEKLQLRRYNATTGVWDLVPVQFIDYARSRIIAEIASLSQFALFTVEQPAIPAVLPATVRLEPEALNVNPGILTAFVSLPAGYPASGIIGATCDGALYERMMLNDDGSEMILKFRRRDIEVNLAVIGETIDVYFIIRGVWQDEAGVFHTFQGWDSITKIVGGN